MYPRFTIVHDTSCVIPGIASISTLAPRISTGWITHAPDVSLLSRKHS